MLIETSIPPAVTWFSVGPLCHTVVSLSHFPGGAIWERACWLDVQYSRAPWHEECLELRNFFHVCPWSISLKPQECLSSFLHYKTLASHLSAWLCLHIWAEPRLETGGVWSLGELHSWFSYIKTTIQVVFLELSLIHITWFRLVFFNFFKDQVLWRKDFLY